MKTITLEIYRNGTLENEMNVDVCHLLGTMEAAAIHHLGKIKAKQTDPSKTDIIYTFKSYTEGNKTTTIKYVYKDLPCLYGMIDTYKLRG